MSAFCDDPTEPCPVRVGTAIRWGNGPNAREFEVTAVNERPDGSAEVRLTPIDDRAGLAETAVWMVRADVRRRLRGESAMRRIER